MAKKPGTVYIVKCADGTLYTGWATDVKARVKVHNAGKGAKYCRGARLPVVLVYSKTFDSQSEAMHAECAIKRLNRIEKLGLLDHSHDWLDLAGIS